MNRSDLSDILYLVAPFSQNLNGREAVLSVARLCILSTELVKLFYNQISFLKYGFYMWV